MATTLQWEDNRFRTTDGYEGGVAKFDGVRLDGYLAEVTAPGWTYTGRFATAPSAKSWCSHIVARDRRAPMQRNPE